MFALRRAEMKTFPQNFYTPNDRIVRRIVLHSLNSDENFIGYSMNVNADVQLKSFTGTIGKSINALFLPCRTFLSINVRCV